MALRDSWIEREKRVCRCPSCDRTSERQPNVSQMHLGGRASLRKRCSTSRSGEKLRAGIDRSEVALRRMIIPANVNHRNLERWR